MSKGFIRLSRKFFNTDFWLQQRSFSLSEAWLDLIQLARFDAGPTFRTKILLNGRKIGIKRGELHSSVRFLASRWGWGVEKTQKYLVMLVEKGMIERRTEQGETVINLVNYNTYNPPPKPPPNTGQYTGQYTDRTPTSTPTSTNKKNIKNSFKNSEEAAAQPRESSGGVSDFSETVFDAKALVLLDEMIVEWNTMPHVKRFDALEVPEAIRTNFAHRLREHGPDGIRQAMAKMKESKFWKHKGTTPRNFKWFVSEKFQDLLDGMYDEVYDDPATSPPKTNQTREFRKEDYHVDPQYDGRGKEF